MPLDARIEAARLRELYKEDPRQSRFTALVIGERGVGKTSLLRTARMPAFIDSFDSTGTIPLHREIDKGDIVPDTRWENDSPSNPHAWEAWKTAFRIRKAEGLFKEFGTYMLDSTSSWSLACMNAMVRNSKKILDGPGWPEYKRVRQETEIMLLEILSLPCDIIVTGHLEPIYNEDGRVIKWEYMATGKGSTMIPLHFSEKWVMRWIDTPEGGGPKILTKPHTLYNASSRLASLGKLEPMEAPNIKTILKKAGFNVTDKPQLT